MKKGNEPPKPNYDQLGRLSAFDIYRYLMWRYGRHNDTLKQLFNRFGLEMVKAGRINQYQLRLGHYAAGEVALD